MEAKEVAEVLFSEIFSRYGAPRTLVSDRGQNFMSKLVQALCKLFQVTRHYTSSYHPQTNAACERMNSTILQTLRSYCKKDQSDWTEYIPAVMMAYRSTPATQSTQFSPFYLLFGQEMRLPVDVALQPKPTLAAEPKLHLARVLEQLKLSREVAAQNMKEKQHKYTQQHDKKAENPNFMVGSKVWLYCSRVPKGKSPKLIQKWTGPYTIILLGPNNTFKLRNNNTYKIMKSLVHVQRLKEYHNPEERPNYFLPEYHDLQLNPEELEDDDDIQQDDAGTTDDNDSDDEILSQNTQNTKQNNTQSTQQTNNSQVTQPLSQPDNHTQNQQSQTQVSTQTRHQAQTSGQQTNKKPTPVKYNNSHKESNLKDDKLIFKSEQIVKILEYGMQGESPVYKVRLVGEPRAFWYYAYSIPQELIDIFHKNYTHKGRKRKRKSPQKKFFNQTENQTVKAMTPFTKSRSKETNKFNMKLYQEIMDAKISKDFKKSSFFVSPLNKWLSMNKVPYQILEPFLIILGTHTLQINNGPNNPEMDGIPVLQVSVQNNFQCGHYIQETNEIVFFFGQDSSAGGLIEFRHRIVNEFDKIYGPIPKHLLLKI